MGAKVVQTKKKNKRIQLIHTFFTTSVLKTTNIVFLKLQEFVHL